MLALVNTPLRRWLLASLLLPLLTVAFAKVADYLQRRHGGAPTTASRFLRKLSALAGRFSKNPAIEQHSPPTQPAPPEHP